MSGPYLSQPQHSLSSVTQPVTIKNHLNPVITAQVSKDDVRLLDQHHKAAKNKTQSKVSSRISKHG